MMVLIMIDGDAGDSDHDCDDDCDDDCCDDDIRIISDDGT